MTEKSKIDKWDAALEELGAAHKHRKEMQGKPGAELAQKDLQKALNAYEKASSELG
jgi:hypothetical protein